MPSRTLFLAFLLAVAPNAAPASAPPKQPSPEENILRKAGVAVDGDGLLTFFRGRTLGDAEIKRIGDLIKRLGADDFDDRERAAGELRKVGGRATPLVRAAARTDDAEIVRRAKQYLKEVDAPPPLPAVAAARLLARGGPAAAVPVLLDYLPYADDGAVEDEVLAALLTLTPDGKADPALAAALDDPRPWKRAAAAHVLGRKGDKGQREAVRGRLKDADAGVRWQAARALLAAHDGAAVPALAALLADGPFDTAWRAEELLRRLAGDGGPAEELDDSVATRRKCRDAWAAWWKAKGDGFDLSGYKEAERPLGYTLGVEYNTGRVWECDIDGTIRWELRDLPGPMDAQVLPNGNVLIAEADAHRIVERDLKGVVKWEKKIDGEPNGCQRLANGNTFVSTALFDGIATPPARAMEFAPNGSMVYSIELETGGCGPNAVCKGGDGIIYYVTASSVIAVAATGKCLGEIHLPIRDESHYVGLAVLPGKRFLLTDTHAGQVLEVTVGDYADWAARLPDDLKSLGRRPAAPGEQGSIILWQADVTAACGLTWLPNGHKLVGTNHKMIELDSCGKTVWEAPATGFVRRVYRR